MNKSVIAFIFVLILAPIYGCSNHSTPPGPEPIRELTATEKQVVQSAGNFGPDFFAQVVSENPDTNVVVSPLSVEMAMAMAYNGADGATREAIQTTLALDGLTHQEVNEAFKGLIDLLVGLDDKVDMSIANSVWLREGFTAKRPFINDNKQYLNAEVKSLDFSEPASVGTMNKWVSDNTNGLIEEIVEPPINPLTMLFLINALYFNGDWANQFDSENTTEQPFTLPDNSTTPCQMMRITEKLPYYSNELFQAVDLPYGNGLFHMMVLLPRNDIHVNTIIQKMTSQEMTSDNWKNWIDSCSEHEITLHMPKFKLEIDLLLNDALCALGMEEAFDSQNADFTNITEMALSISKVKHKVYIRVDEKGTEAAAVTSTEMSTTSLPPVMRVDRPFLFVIHESHSGALLFMGKVTCPLL
ncbi:MAG: serpin family protein [candidate division Zixibacteria bacterium]|nr:serpin family protein [candidate division Zixibacteria bacterium]